MLTCRHHHFHQPNHILVSQPLQELDLAHGRDGEPLLFALHPDPLERHKGVGIHVPRLVHFTIRALTDTVEALVHFTRGEVVRWLRVNLRVGLGMRRRGRSRRYSPVGACFSNRVNGLSWIVGSRRGGSLLGLLLVP
jgi:hypothetical protein